MSLADELASPTGLVALQVYVISVSSMTTLLIVSVKVSSCCSRWYLSDSDISTPDISHVTSGCGMPCTEARKLAGCSTVTNMSVSGCKNVGTSNTMMTSAEDIASPCSLKIRIVYSPPSSIELSFITKVITRSSVIVTLNE